MSSFTPTEWIDGVTPVTASQLNRLESAVGSVAGNSLRQLAIYYSIPQSVNAAYANDTAAAYFSRYDDVVLGAGLEDPANGYHTSTAEIMALSDNVDYWGYINAGVSNGNESLSTLRTRIARWSAMGAHGIFVDCIGYAYQTSRARQNAIIDECHKYGMPAILNSFSADEVFASTVNATYNATGTPTTAQPGDVLLLESLVSSEQYTNPYWAVFSDVVFRAAKARTYKDSLGIKVYCSSTATFTGATESDLDKFRDVQEGIARAYGFDAAGLDCALYSGSGADEAKLFPRYQKLRTLPKGDGKRIVDATSITRVDLGLKVDWTAKTAVVK